MARWLCNAPLPGSELRMRGIVKTGVEFTTPDDPDDLYFERARESWIPLDAAAEKLVAKAKKDADKIAKDRADESARRRQLEDDARAGTNTRPFETKPYQIDQHFGLGAALGEKVPQDEEIQKRNEAWTKQVRKDQKKDFTPEELAAQAAVREQIALSGGAAAQSVADPDLAVTGASDRDSKGTAKKTDEKGSKK